MAHKSSHLKQKPAKEPKLPKAPKASAPKTAPKNSDGLLLIRLVLATVIFAVSLVVDMPEVLSTALLAISVLVAGYDVIIRAVNAVEQKDFFATPVVVFVVAVLSFVIGFGMEGAALMMLYQIGLWLIAYASERSKKTALDLLRYQDEETVTKVSVLVEEGSAGNMEIESVMRQSSSLILKIAMVIAVVYAAVLPLATSYSYIVSIHRALTIILIATPMSVVVAMPITGITGLCYSASQGVVFNNARVMEKFGLSNVAVFDKAGVFTENTPRVISVKPELIDHDTFMNFASHAVYYSDQPLAKAVSAVSDQDYKLELISDFADIPGMGVELKIAGNPVILANRELFEARGFSVPEEAAAGQAFYMMISGRYVGQIIISAKLDDETSNIASEISGLGVKRVILVTEDSNSATQRLAEELDIKEAYGECGTEKKLGLLRNLKEGSRNRVAFIYSNGIEAHSAADVDIRVSKKAKYSDAIVIPGNVNNIGFSLQVCRRMKEIAISNALFAFIVKAVLIFLSIVGYCNIWFAIFVDMAAAIGTVLNTIRVTQNSLVTNIKYKSGR